MSLYWDSETLNNLVGFTPKEMWLTEDDGILYLVGENETWELETDGDCCSESWWADGLGVKQLLGYEITTAETIELPTPNDDRTRQEEDEAYGFRLVTKGGVCTLVFRNSSNGYYGGWADLRRADSHGGRQITEDFSN